MELYHNNKVLPKKLSIDSSDIDNLQFTWNYENNVYYTLIIYDIDTPSFFVHLLVTNIPRNDIEYGTIIRNYIKPNPPLGSNNHRYIIAVFEQSGIIFGKKFNEISKFRTERKFPLLDFIEENNLNLLDKKMIIVNSSTDNNNLSNSKYNKSKNNIIRQDSDLDNRSQKYCSCIIRVAEKNTEGCNSERNWGNVTDGKMCYSPYAVCAKNIKTTSRECGVNYDYETMTKEQLISFLNLKNIKVNKSLNKNQLLDIILDKEL